MKLRKIITMSLAAIMAVSAMSISAFAKEVVELEDGVIMTVYEPGETMESIPTPRTIDFETFGHTIGKYPNWSPIMLDSTRKTTLTLGGDESVIQIDFDDNNEYDFGYQGLYDITGGKYIKDGQGNILSGPFHVGSRLRFTGLKENNSYRVLLSSNLSNVYASGTVWSY